MPPRMVANVAGDDSNSRCFNKHPDCGECVVKAKKWGKYPACQFNLHQETQAGSLRHMTGQRQNQGLTKH